MALLLLAGLGWGCDDLGEFSTRPGVTKYAGCIVGDLPSSFIRSGRFRPFTAMEMQFDPADATLRPPMSINAITTTAPNGERLFDATPLLPIAALAHDALSGHDFPGAGRVRNYIFLARPASGPLADKDTMVFLSLMESEGVEVRIVGGAYPPVEDAGPDPESERSEEEQFGFFRLTRRDAASTTNCVPPPP
jgi:hypothetical protein